MLIVQVALDVPLPTLFDYLCAEEDSPAPGLRVIVPFGRARRTPRAGKDQGSEVEGNEPPQEAQQLAGQATGIIVAVRDRSEVPPERLKPVTRVLHDIPPLADEWRALADFCARYYHKPLGEVILPALPPRLRTGKELRVKVSAAAKPRKKTASRRKTKGDAAHTPSDCESAANAVASGNADGSAHVAVAPNAAVLNAQHGDAEGNGTASSNATPAETSHAAAPQPGFLAAHALNAQQAAIVEDIGAALDTHGVHLLLGITGSGKSEVYFHLIARTLAAGRQALVLVPEIALTPALAQGFRTRFPGAIITMQHSATVASARTDGWLAAQAGRAHIVLGTRLAVFTPLARPGLIVVDEEQDPSFKQQDGLRYNARDLAVYRASQAGIPILLCSATPSLETYQHALTGRYRMHTLEARASADARLPEVVLMDTRRHKLSHGLAVPLVDAVRQRLARGEQTLIFLNRRGYAPVLSCASCGWTSPCPDCSSHLVVHLAEGRLRCHHCGYGCEVPRACPQCGNLDLQPLGRGTQRLEATLADLFPEARVLRIDADSTRNRGSLEAALAKVQDGEADIIVGTQILAKGHDFARVTLVAILNADAGLFAADYRASERLFAQVLQVAGRAGRANLPGEVWIQTRFPEHPLYQAVLNHDYRGFAEALLEERQSAGFPPFAFEAALRAEAAEVAPAQAFLEAAIAAAPEHGEEITLFQPVPMALARRARLERVQVVVQSHSRPALQRFLAAWMPALYSVKARNVRWHMDVDPTEF